MVKNKQGLSQREIEQLYEEYANGNLQARTKLVEANLGLAKYFAYKYQNSGVDYDDLLQIGSIGLIKAIDKFDISKGAKLSSYISTAIENEILMYLRKNNKFRNDLSFDAPIGQNKDGDEMTVEDILRTDPDELYDSVIANMKIDIVRETLQKLTSKEQKLILLRYGLGDDKNLSQAEISDLFGKSRSYIIRQEKKALVKMRHPKITRKIKDFIDE